MGQIAGMTSSLFLRDINQSPVLIILNLIFLSLDLGRLFRRSQEFSFVTLVASVTLWDAERSAATLLLNKDKFKESQIQDALS